MTWSRPSRPSFFCLLASGCAMLGSGPGWRHGAGGPARGYVSPGELAIRGDRLYASVWMSGGPEDARREARLIGEDVPSERISLRPVGAGLYACRAFPEGDPQRPDATCSFSAATLRPGPYRLQVLLDDKTVASTAIDLVEVAGANGSAPLTVDPVQRAYRLIHDEKGYLVWVPLSLRRPAEVVTLAWFRDGKLVSHRSAIVEGPRPAAGVPLINFGVLRVADDPLREGGEWQVLAIVDGRSPVAAWDVSARRQGDDWTSRGFEFRLPGSLYGFFEPATIPPSDLGELARRAAADAVDKLSHKNAKRLAGFREELVCALTRDPAVFQALVDMDKAAGAERAALKRQADDGARKFRRGCLNDILPARLRGLTD